MWSNRFWMAWCSSNLPFFSWKWQLYSKVGLKHQSFCKQPHKNTWPMTTLQEDSQVLSCDLYIYTVSSSGKAEMHTCKPRHFTMISFHNLCNQNAMSFGEATVEPSAPSHSVAKPQQLTSRTTRQSFGKKRPFSMDNLSSKITDYCI